MQTQEKQNQQFHHLFVLYVPRKPGIGIQMLRHGFQSWLVPSPQPIRWTEQYSLQTDFQPCKSSDLCAPFLPSHLSDYLRIAHYQLLLLIFLNVWS